MEKRIGPPPRIQPAMYCNNCGAKGHLFRSCNDPVLSCGIILIESPSLPLVPGLTRLLMIRRKDSMSFAEFMRGKYDVDDTDYVSRLIGNMTIEEQKMIANESFETTWRTMWGDDHLSGDYASSQQKFNAIDRAGIVKNNPSAYNEPEWGFPKGRRNNQEKDYNCAIREFCEETGYAFNNLNNIQNVLPFEENFTGSNYKSYKHKYFLMYMNYKDTLDASNFQKSEVSKMEWKTIDECIECIRPYNLEKIKLISNIDKCLSRNFISYC